MKLTKSILREMIKDVLSEADIMDKEIKNPKTGNMIKVKTALQLPDEHPTNKKAKQMVAKTPTKKSVGGKKAKGAKTSKDIVKGPKPGGEFTIDKVMNATIGGEKVGDILDNPKHSNYDKAEKYASQFDPDDEKVVSGGGSKVKGPKPDGDWDNEQVMNATIGGEKVSDIFNDEEHPDYDKALNYIMSFDPDDEKVVSGTGGPSYSNVPKGAKSSAQAKIMKKSDEYAKSEDYKDTKQLVQNGNATELSHFLNHLDDNGLSDKAYANIEKTIDKIDDLSPDDFKNIQAYNKKVMSMRGDIFKKSKDSKNYGEKKESITSKIKKEFKQYNNINKNLTRG